MCHQNLKPLIYHPCLCCKIPSQKNFKKKFKINARLRRLAIPQHVNKKFYPPSPEPLKTKIEIVKEIPISTRLNQLAIPYVRKLEVTRNEYARLRNKYLTKRLNDLIDKSLFTVYSRLANVRIPEKRKKIIKWTDDEWNAHELWFNSRVNIKLPHRIKKPAMFTDPIRKLPPRDDQLAKPLPLAVRNFLQKWVTYEDNFKKRHGGDIYKPPSPPMKYKEWKVKRLQMKEMPVSKYYEEYTQYLKAISAEAKQKLEQRMKEINPQALPRIDNKKHKETLKRIYESRPKWVEKLCERPAWIMKQIKKELEIEQYAELRHNSVGDRTKIKWRPNPVTLKLARLDKVGKETTRKLLQKMKQEKEKLNKPFKCPKAIKKGLSPKSPIHKLSLPVESRKRKKVQLIVPEVPFKNYW